MSRYSSTELLGVNAVECLTLKELGWIFRVQPTVDMGIDAHIELVSDKNPTGKLLGVQIKTGASHFQEKDDSLVYYGTLTHLDYWLSHSLPVILVAHLPNSNETFWVHVNETTTERTGKAWKISIPKNQPLNASSIPALEEIISGSKEEIKRRNLFLHAGNMRFLKSGGKLIIYKEEWHNKTLGRGIVELIKVNPDGSEESIEKENYWYTGFNTKELIEKIYPWATLGIDKMFYEENFEESFYEVYSDLYKDKHDIYPYATTMGEISLYRLELKLNNLGEAFIFVLDHLESEA